jgi:hypothetical protein
MKTENTATGRRRLHACSKRTGGLAAILRMTDRFVRYRTFPVAYRAAADRLMFMFSSRGMLLVALDLIPLERFRARPPHVRSVTFSSTIGIGA